MAKDRRYFLRLIGPAGNIEFIAIDPNQLTLDNFTQLYQKGDAGAGQTGGLSRQYVPVATKWSLKAPDLSELISVLNDVTSTGVGQIGAFKSAELFTNSLGDIKLWEVLLEQISTGQIGLAKNTLEELLWELIGSATGIAAELDQLTIKAEGHEAHATVVSQVLETEAKHLQEHYLSWGAAADGVLQVIRKIESLKASADQLLVNVEQALEARKKLRSFSERLLQQLVLFNKAAKAYLFDGSGDIPEQIRLEQETSFLAQLEASAQTAWDSARTLFSKESSAINSNLARLAADFGAAQVRLQIFEEQHLQASDIRPWQFSRDIISEADYQQALMLIGTTWAEVATRIETPLSGGRALLNERPAITPEIAEAITHAARYTPLLISPTDIPVKIEVTPTTDINTSTVTASRSTTLYELLAAVAYILTCNKSPITGSTVKNMLQVLLVLKLVTEEEASNYQGLRNLITARGQLASIGVNEKVSEQWEQTQLHFIAYVNPWEETTKAWFAGEKLKLSKAGGILGKEMLEKYSLTQERIREAYKTFTSARQKSRESKK